MGLWRLYAVDYTSKIASYQEYRDLANIYDFPFAFLDSKGAFIKNCGAKISMLSGSGPAVFGLFSEEKAAEDCCKKLCDMGISAYLCETTDKGIVIE